MRSVIFILVVLLITIGVSLWLGKQEKTYNLTTTPTPAPTPLVQYSIKNLQNRQYQTSKIIKEKVIKEDQEFTSYIFSFQSDGKKITGQLNVPKGQGPFPVVVMLRGYADKEIYFTGLGTRKAAGELAKAGFITLAPDFLGFGGSDWETKDIIEARLEKPVTVLNLIQSISSLPMADTQNVFLWGHSNGGQIALTVLAVTGKSIPTVLWAPVTRDFPQNVFDYVGELDDQGKMVMASISAFLKSYDPQQFSVSPNLVNINAPLQVHQGGSDPLVKKEWTDKFVEKMKGLGKQTSYYTYHLNDHNLTRDWDTVVARNVKFFKNHLK